MARATRSRPAARNGQAKSGSGKASPLPGNGKGAGKAAAKKRKGKAKLVEEEDMEEDEGEDDDLADDPGRDNSDDSDYQDGSSADEEAESEGDETDDDDSDFEMAKKKTKRSSSTGGNPSAGKKPQATARSAPNGTLSGNYTGISSKNGPKKGSKTDSTAASSVAKANEAAAAAAGASAGNYEGGASSTAGAGGAGTGAAASVKVGKGPAMRYVCEIAKSGRALCRRCDEKISKDALKVGVVTEGSWGPSTQWHHMQCTIFQVKTAEEVEGFEDLDDAIQPLLEQQVLKSQGEVDDMYEPITPDDLVRKEWTEKASCPDKVMATLLPYQAEGLAWMLNQEKLPYKGGILADEMGMGKTLQAICTLVANLPNAKDKTMQKRWAQSEEEMGRGGASAGSRGGTLVVCPTIALKQWQSELVRFVKPGTLKVVIHHGAKRAALAEDLVKADVVLTTYAIVENEHRKAYAGNKVACPDCGRTLYPDKMFTHRKYFCGEGAQRTEAQAKTQRKGGSSWRRKNQGKKRKKANLSDSDNGTTKINIKVKNKGKGGGRSGTEGTKRKGFGSKGAGGKNSDNNDVESDGLSDDATTKVRVRVKSSTRPGRASSAAKGKRKDKAVDSSDEEDSSEDAQTPRSSASKKRKPAQGGKGRSRGKGKTSRREESENDDHEDGGTTDISKSTRDGKGRGGGRAKGNGKGKRKRKGGEDRDSDFEGTTDISNRNKQKGKKKRAAKGKGAKTKRAADDSASDWASGSDGSGSSSSGDESEGRSYKEAAFAKVLKEVMEKRDNAEPGVLQEISWQRIILDEAHFIKDRSTSTAKAVFALTSLYKWCLTGTPLQNRVGELYSLVRFLRLDPHAFYQCRSKGCNCKSLNYRFGPEWRACEECGHTPIMHYANFNRHILNPISRTGYVGEGKKAFLKLKREVLDQILLRRTKSNRSNDICLPPRIVRVRQHRLDEREEDFYQALYTQSQAQFDTYVGSGTILNNYAHIFDILIRLRQAVDHPYLVIYSATKREGMTPAMNSPASQTRATSSAQPATTPSQGSPPPRFSAPMPTAVVGGTNGKPGSRATRASRTDSSGGGGGCGDGDSPHNKEGGAAGALGDTSSDSLSDGVEAATGKSGAIGSAVKPVTGDEGDSDEEDMDACGICSEPAERPVSSSCGHFFCRTCVQELIDTAPGDVECPTCSEPLTVDLSGGSPGCNGQDEAESDEVGGGRGHGRGRRGTGGGGRNGSRGRGGARRDRGAGGGGSNDGAKGRMANMVATLAASVKKTVKNKKHASSTFKNSVTKHSVVNRIDLSKFQSSTKMEALMEEVHLMQERDPAAKAIVFSQFVNMLDLIEYRMHKGQVGCRKLSGHLSVDKREEVLQAFQNDAGVKVLLISLKAGGVALNLTVANHIFLMDPWWNPAAEMQAIDRTHRLGQFKPIYATRFIIEDTVEERIIKLQEKKQLVFDSTVGGDAASTGKLTVDDLRFLFAH